MTTNSLFDQNKDENNLNSSIMGLHSVTVLIQQVLSIGSNSIILFLFILLIKLLILIYF